VTRAALILALVFVLPACVTGQQGSTAPAAGAGPSTSTECKMGSDGRQVCGYHCQMGSDGVVACADTPDGTCAMGADGRVTCSRVARKDRAPDAAGPPAECKMGSDGKQYCGYNCQLGSDGRFYCASRPDGRCALNADGSFTCP